MENYAIIEQTKIINTAVADADFAKTEGWILLPDGFGIGDFYIDGQFVKAPQPQPTPEEIQSQNKQEAQSLLQQTDWTCTVDINNPQYSNPYLANQDEFLAYRSTARQIAVNPPTTPAVFPPMPEEVWASV
jgi:hypothetical protein